MPVNINKIIESKTPAEIVTIAKQYRDGIGCEKDKKTAIELLLYVSKTLNPKYAVELFDLVWGCEDESLPQCIDILKSIPGNIDYINARLAKAYYYGKGTEKNIDLAIDLMLKSAKSGIFWCKTELFDMLWDTERLSDIHDIQQWYVPIVFATNENYAPYAAVTIESILDVSKKDVCYEFFILHTDLSEEYIARFEKIKSYRHSVHCINITKYLDNEISLYENLHFSKEMYYRILIPTLLGVFNKVLYLDCDMVVLSDINNLYNIDLKGNVLGGVNDISHSISKNYIINTVKIDPANYINSGMLLIDTGEFNKQKIKEKCFDILKTSEIKFRYPDQDIINISCQGHIHIIDPTWNYIWHYNFPRFNQTPDLLLSPDDQKRYDELSKSDLKLIHYTSNIKPWNNYNTQYTAYFFKYVSKAQSFKDIIYQRYNSIGMKNYVVLQFIDKHEDKLFLTGAFYSIEQYLYGNKIKYTLDKDYDLKIIYSRNIDLRGYCYVQNFFIIEIPCSELSDLNIYFHREERDEKLPLLTGKYFPINKTISSVFYINNHQFFIKDNCLKTNTVFDIDQSEKRIIENIKKNTKTKYLRLGKVRKLLPPANKKELWLISDRTGVAGDNGEVFFRYLNREHKNDVESIFVIDKHSPDYKRLKTIGQVISPYSFRYKYLFLKANKIVSSQLDLIEFEPFNLEQLKDKLLNQKIIFLQHGITKDDISRAYSKFNQNISLFITASKRERESIIGNFSYGLLPFNVALTGFARFDNLVNDPQKIIYIIPTWRKKIADLYKDNKIEELKQTDYYKANVQLINDINLIDLANNYGYTIKYVPHPLMKKLFASSEMSGIEIDCNTPYSEIFKNGSVLITDYSSVAFDFAYLKKPIIYYQYDQTQIFTEHTYKPGYFDYSKDGFGPVVTELQNLYEQLENVLKNNCKNNEIYMWRIEEFFEFFDKNNCDRIYESICSIDKL